jgi:hypothetical protein
MNPACFSRMKLPSGFRNEVVAANHDSDGGSGDGGGTRTRARTASFAICFAIGTSLDDVVAVAARVVVVHGGRRPVWLLCVAPAPAPACVMNSCVLLLDIRECGGLLVVVWGRFDPRFDPTRRSGTCFNPPTCCAFAPPPGSEVFGNPKNPL